MKDWIYCVGFQLQYSPLHRNCMENLGQTILQHVTEFTFEVITSLEEGSNVVIMFSNPSSPTQQMLATVESCQMLADEHYLIKISTNPENMITTDSARMICLPIIKGTSIAHEMTINCPSCKNRSQFKYVANQNGDWDEGILPIYNCGECGTSRAMVGLVSG